MRKLLNPWWSGTFTQSICRTIRPRTTISVRLYNSNNPCLISPVVMSIRNMTRSPSPEQSQFQLASVVVVIYLDAEQTDGSIRYYHGEYVVGYENGKPKIVDATVTEDLPATPTPTPDYTAMRCKADSLSATAGYQGATGSMAGSIILTNTGTEPCSLQGTAQVKLVDSYGQELVTEQKAMSLDGIDQLITLKPGQQASLFIVWANWCPPGTPETAAASPMAGGVSFQVTLPDGHGVLTAKAMLGHKSDTLVPRCDVPGQSSTLSVGTFKDFPAP